MPLLGKTLSDREKVALFYHVWGGCDDWTKLFFVADSAAYGQAEKDIKYLSDYVSKWKRSEKVKKYVDQLRAEKSVKEFKQREEIKNELREEMTGGDSERKNGQPARRVAGFVDYTNPDNQRQKLNELINGASDPGEALDALKVIIAGQRDDKQAAKEQRQVRAYLPQQCQECPLYQRARKKVTL